MDEGHQSELSAKDHLERETRGQHTWELLAQHVLPYKLDWMPQKKEWVGGAFFSDGYKVTATDGNDVALPSSVLNNLLMSSFQTAGFANADTVPFNQQDVWVNGRTIDMIAQRFGSSAEKFAELGETFKTKAKAETTRQLDALSDEMQLLLDGMLSFKATNGFVNTGGSSPEQIGSGYIVSKMAKQFFKESPMDSRTLEFKMRAALSKLDVRPLVMKNTEQGLWISDESIKCMLAADPEKLEKVLVNEFAPAKGRNLVPGGR